MKISDIFCLILFAIIFNFTSPAFSSETNKHSDSNEKKVNLFSFKGNTGENDNTSSFVTKSVPDLIRLPMNMNLRTGSLLKIRQIESITEFIIQALSKESQTLLLR